MMLKLSLLALAILAGHSVSTEAVLTPDSPPNIQSTARCRNIPGDAGWPQPQTWSELNRTVNGRLIATVPLGSVCHDPTYDEVKCKQLAANWGLVQIAVPKPAEFVSPYFQNNSCTPFSPRSAKCELGNYVSYSIDVRSIDDVRAGLKFARENNVRLVIQNSGHDFYGQSTGKGALALWMHNYNEKQMISDYSSSYYNGPALRVQTGVEGGVAAAYVTAHGYTVVSGACPTVKMAGGYLAGGGHSYLSGTYGFAADNVLEWEVVKADGSLVIATPSENQDLYWALAGGGGGTYGVVLSATVRVFPSEVAASAAFSLTVGQAGGVEAYWDSVSAFHQQLKPLVDQGIVAEYVLSNESLVVTGIMALGRTRDSLKSLLKPLTQSLLGIPGSSLTEDVLAIKYAQANSDYELYRDQIQPQLEDFRFPATMGGRFIPRTCMEQNSSSVDKVLREIANKGYVLIAMALNVINGGRNQTAPPIAPNAVQPNFFSAYNSLIISPRWSNDLPWSEAEVLQKELMDEILPLYDAAVPDAGVYKNEGNWADRDIKKLFYDGTYERLERIKNEVDPTGLFYGITSVGFDRFQLDGSGRLCRK